jgi:PAS domain S-box-containing protein
MPDTAAHPRHDALPPRVGTLLAFSVACFVLAAASIEFTKEAGRVAAIWPMNAFVLAVMLRGTLGSWVGVITAAASGNLAAALVCGDELPVALTLTLANVVEILFCFTALGLRRNLDITRLHDLLRFIACGIGGPALSATIAASALATFANANFAESFAIWFAADALGLLVFAPAALTFDWQHLVAAARGPWWRSPLLSLIPLAAASLAVFTQSSYPLLFVPGPFLILVAFQLGTTGVGLGLSLTAVIAITCAVAGLGPTQLIDDSVTVQIILLQTFLAFLSVATLPVASALAERDRMRLSLEEARTRLLAAQEEADASETRFRHMAEVSSDTMARMDSDGVIRFVSPSVERMMGYEPAELIGHTTMRFTHPDDIPRVMSFFADLIAQGPGGTPVAYQFRARHKNGSWIWLEGIPKVLFDASGKPTGIQDSVRDITRRKVLEADLDAALARTTSSERRLQMALEIADIVVFQRNKVTGELRVSGPQVRALGRELPAVVELQEFFELVHEDDRAMAMESWARHLAGGPRMVIEHRLQWTGQWVRTVVEMTRDAAGEHTGSVGLIMNINDRKAAEVELARARDKAETAMRVKSEFLANMSHEIRTPLNSIIGFTRILSASTALNERDRHYVEIIEGAGRSLVAIVNDILDFSGLEDGAIKLSPRNFDLRKLVEQVAESFAPAAAEKGLSIVVDVARSLAPAHFADDARLRQVLVNLAGNAIKFTSNGSVTLGVSASAPSNGAQRITIDVRDTGIGIAADKIAGLFARFAQADSSINRRFGGSGLGLAISKRLVEMMGGNISVASTLGSGATFSLTVEMPCAESPIEMAATEPEADTPGRPCRILVADDVDMNRRLLRALLEPAGHGIDEVDDGGEAIRAVEKNSYDLVLMDVQMPGVDGLTAARTIRALGKTVPIVALTAQALPEQIKSCRAAGMVDYVAKPVVPEQLFAAVRKWAVQAMPNTPGPATAPADAVMTALRDKFIARCKDDLRAIHTLMSQPAGDAREALHQLVHRLAGTAGTFGYSDLGALAGDLDQVCARGGLPGDTEVQRLAANLEALVREAA